jgi:cytoskeletal protein CcmA (bactofilin family)
MGRIRQIVCLLLSVSLLVPASAVHAFGAVSSQSYVLPADAVHDGDLAVNASTVTIEGTVDGDLYVFAENVQVNGRVTGDVLSFAAATRIGGTVEGDVRAFTQNLSISGRVERNVTAGSSHIVLEQSGQVGGSLLMFTPHADLYGKVAREANGRANTLRITGEIGEGISLLHCGSLRIDAPAVIGGDLVYSSPQRAVIGSGAVLKGRELYSPPAVNSDQNIFSYFPILLGLSSLLSTLLLWLAVRFLFPAGLSCIYSQLDRRPGQALTWGTGFVLGLPLLSLVLLVTVVGIPVAVTLLLAFLLLTWSAKVFVGSWIGIRLAERFRWRLSPLLAELLGVVALQCLLIIPFAGWLFALPVWMAFLGALAGAVRQANKTFLTP